MESQTEVCINANTEVIIHDEHVRHVLISRAAIGRVGLVVALHQLRLVRFKDHRPSESSTRTILNVKFLRGRLGFSELIAANS